MMTDGGGRCVEDINNLHIQVFTFLVQEEKPSEESICLTVQLVCLHSPLQGRRWPPDE